MRAVAPRLQPCFHEALMAPVASTAMSRLLALMQLSMFAKTHAVRLPQTSYTIMTGCQNAKPHPKK